MINLPELLVGMVIAIAVMLAAASLQIFAEKQEIQIGNRASSITSLTNNVERLTRELRQAKAVSTPGGVSVSNMITITQCTNYSDVDCSASRTITYRCYNDSSAAMVMGVPAANRCWRRVNAGPLEWFGCRFMRQGTAAGAPCDTGFYIPDGGDSVFSFYEADAAAKTSAAPADSTFVEIKIQKRPGRAGVDAANSQMAINDGVGLRDTQYTG